MTSTLEPGVQGVLERTVAAEHCTRRGEYDIFSTPNLVLLLEEAAIEGLAPHLRDDQASVGSKVDIAHIAPTLRGQTVRATATVTEVDRRRVLFDIRVEDDKELIGQGTHERFVVDLPSFEDRLAAKAGQLQ
ncbi:thioesterase family protein [Blastococcus haudaquaticus]|uniref:Thioesterase superfamily n=1 Tax=Blastococcus haudaquaticus TaxID=1938745 RepID=A0A286H7R5_9ACTN|nr:thioesterase family protein [Blastococcus haudaquaticus]SOE03840.1 Thioesterase superfamily [Blastococcus haudaquaticus]